MIIVIKMSSKIDSKIEQKTPTPTQTKSVAQQELNSIFSKLWDNCHNDLMFSYFGTQLELLEVKLNDSELENLNNLVPVHSYVDPNMCKDYMVCQIHGADLWKYKDNYVYFGYSNEDDYEEDGWLRMS